MNIKKTYNVKDEIVKWLINEGHIKTPYDIRYLTYRQLILYYQSKI